MRKLVAFLCALLLVGCSSLPWTTQHTDTDADGKTYTGEFKDDMRHGQGTAASADGKTYTGAFKDDKANGQGTVTFADGGTYTGEFKDGMANGQGTGTYANGNTYTGEVKDDEFNGQGTYNFADGTSYTGAFRGNRFNGQGTITSANGETYNGAFKDGKRHGFGTETEADGTYTGEFKDDKVNGQGTMTFASGGTYTGAWKDGKRHGQGTMTWADGSTYTGEFKFDSRSGQGTWTDANGITYTGKWKDGERHGKGTYVMWKVGAVLAGSVAVLSVVYALFVAAGAVQRLAGPTNILISSVIALPLFLVLFWFRMAFILGSLYWCGRLVWWLLYPGGLWQSSGVYKTVVKGLAIVLVLRVVRYVLTLPTAQIYEVLEFVTVFALMGAIFVLLWWSLYVGGPRQFRQLASGYKKAVLAVPAASAVFYDYAGNEIVALAQTFALMVAVVALLWWLMYVGGPVLARHLYGRYKKAMLAVLAVLVVVWVWLVFLQMRNDSLGDNMGLSVAEYLDTFGVDDSLLVLGEVPPVLAWLWWVWHTRATSRVMRVFKWMQQ